MIRLICVSFLLMMCCVATLDHLISFLQDSRVVPPCLGPVPYTYEFTIQIIQQVETQ